MVTMNEEKISPMAQDPIIRPADTASERSRKRRMARVIPFIILGGGILFFALYALTLGLGYTFGL